VPDRLQGKSVLITGASAGIGHASALALAAEGAQLIVTARRKERLDALAAEIEKAGGKAIVVAGDAADEATAISAIQAAKNSFGKLDILVNNAGAGNYKPLHETSVAEYDELMTTNMRSTFIFTRHAVDAMLPRKSGMILTVSSVAGIHGFAGEAVYCATKFAQRGFMQALDNELLPKGIRVGLILPGGVKTEFAIGRGRTEDGVASSGMLESEDVAQAVLFACVQPPESRIMEIRMRPISETLV
jgi:NADP-dependent 3-hydroxy acid dehydrogenase YdfG